MTAHFSLGIDLGTSNCAMALTDFETDRTEVLPITQTLAANQLGEKRTLASALYLPHPEEFAAGSFPLPWHDNGVTGIVGQFARDHGGSRARPSGHLRQILAVQPAPRSEGANATLAVRQWGGKAFALRGLTALPAASQERLPPHYARPRQAVGPWATARSS